VPLIIFQPYYVPPIVTTPTVSVKGYVAGGGDYSGTGARSAVIDGFNLSTEAVYSSGITLSVAKGWTSGLGAATVGYICGGDTSTGISNVIEAIDFTTEAKKSISGTLPGTVAYMNQGTCSSTKGYMAGGWTGSVVSNAIKGFSFITETASTLSAVLTNATHRLGTTYSNTSAYFAGGVGSSSFSNIDRLVFSTETKTALAQTLTGPTYDLSSVSGVNKGYFVSGDNTAGNRKTTRGLDFTSEVAADIAAQLSTGRKSMAGLSKSAAGYTCGGDTGGNPTVTLSTQVDRLGFATETITQAIAAISVARESCQGVNPRINYVDPAYLKNTGKGYAVGGSLAAGTVPSSTIDGLRYDTEASILAASSLSTPRCGTFCLSAPTKGYSAGGSANNSLTGVTTNIIDGLNYSDESAFVLSAVLPLARWQSQGISSTLKGYCIGGADTSNSRLASISALTFAGETTATLGAGLATATELMAAVASATKAYVCGGRTNASASITSISGITFATDAVFSSSSVLTVATRNPTGLSNADKGYISGGISTSASLSSVNGLLFSSETVAALSSALTVIARGQAGASSANKGYLMGGYDGTNDVTGIDAITFIGEAIATVSATLRSARDQCSGLSNQVAAVPVDPYWGSVILASNLEDGTITDLKGHTATISGSPAVVTNGTGGKSLSLNAKGDLVQFPNTDFNFTSGDAVIEFWYTPRTLGAGAIIGQSLAGSDNNTFIYTQVGGIIAVGKNGINEIASAAGALVVGVRQHIAIRKTGTTTSIDVNGVQVASATTSVWAFSSSNPLTIGTTATSQMSGSTTFADALIDDLRITKYARYSGVSPADVGVMPTASAGRAYWVGGDNGTTVSSAIGGIELASEAAFTSSSTMAVAKTRGGGVSSTLKGYVYGGELAVNSSLTSNIQALTFAGETCTSISATLTSARSQESNNVMSSAKGYSMGGIEGGTPVNKIDGLLFSTEACTGLSAVLGTASRFSGGGYSGQKGFVIGGYSSTFLATIDSIVFATDTRAAVSATIGTATHGPGSLSGSIKSYIAGGYGTNPAMSTIQGVRFSDETAVSVSATLAAGKYTNSGNSGIKSGKGYLGGGSNGTTTFNSIEGFAYVSETVSAVSAVLATARLDTSTVQSSS